MLHEGLLISCTFSSYVCLPTKEVYTFKTLSLTHKNDKKATISEILETNNISFVLRILISGKNERHYLHSGASTGLTFASNATVKSGVLLKCKCSKTLILRIRTLCHRKRGPVEGNLDTHTSG